MLKTFLSRLHQKHRTVPFPHPSTVPTDRFRGAPRCDFSRCPAGCRQCIDVCPTGALTLQAGAMSLDMGRCIFCTRCTATCPQAAISLTTEYRLACRHRDDLIVHDSGMRLAAALDKKSRSLFGRSLKLREISAAGCNACEADTNVLSTIGFDLSRFGIQFVASPRHADGIFVTGPVSTAMRLAVEKTLQAVAEPRLVIACGTCAISGGIFAAHPHVCNGIPDTIPVDLFIPGCPPHPLTILDGMLRFLGRIG